MDDMIVDFVAEIQEGLNKLDVSLIAFEENPSDSKLLNDIFRTLHTIKGGCGFIGLSRLEKLAHTAETLLDIFRSEKRVATSAEVALILLSLDRIRELVITIESTGAEPAGDDSDLIDLLKNAIAAEGQTAPAAAVATEEVQAEPELVETKPAAKVPATDTPAPEAASQFLRVNVNTLEDILTMVSELVLTRNQLVQISKDAEDSDLSIALRRLNTVVSELQDNVMKTRMQPVGNAWLKFPRIIHDIARESGKKIHLEMLGEEAEIDRQVLEMIKDPLLHMVRNSADHGIETPEERVAAGKRETGTVTLSALHEGGYIIIRIQDDGRGIDPDKIKKTVLKRELATEEHLASLSDRQVYDYIFAPGFSTAEAVTSVSGRGVGMDVVRTNIEKIGGNIELESVLGKGSCFTIRIPLTLAIISSLVVSVNQSLYALPQLNIRELAHVSARSGHKIERVSDRLVMRFRGYLLPLVSMRRLLSDVDVPDEEVLEKECYIVVVTLGSMQFGMIVDQVFDTEEIVVKPTSTLLQALDIYAGNTILGDGRVIMILDPAGVAKISNISALQPHEAAEHEDEEEQQETTSMLLFTAGDDSPKAVSAFLVSRIEEFDRAKVEYSDGQPMIQYRGSLLDLHHIDTMPKTDIIKTLIFADEQSGNAFGVMVDRILDVVESPLDIKPSNKHPGFLGAAIINGHATQVMDVNHFTGNQSWATTEKGTSFSGKTHPRVLIVEDSTFFRHMLYPLLRMAGYDVTLTSGPTEALALCDKGEMFDLIVSDIEMEDMDGLSFATHVKAGSAWQGIPMVALSSRSEERDIQAAYTSGFSAYVTKSNRDALLVTLREVLAGRHSKQQAEG